MVKKKSKSDKAKDIQEHANLAWQILGAKFLYYEGQGHGIPAKMIPADEDYDKWETRYHELCKKLGLKPTATNMVGFDKSRPSCRLVMNHLISTNGQCPIRMKEVKNLKSKENPIKEVKKEVNIYLKTLNEVLEEVGINEIKAKKIRVKMKKRLNP